MRIALTLAILWMSIAVELAWSGSLPHGALLLPIACGVMFWMRSVTGILLPAAALLIDWVARPGFLPLCPMLLPGVAVCLISPSSKTGRLQFSPPVVRTNADAIALAADDAPRSQSATDRPVESVVHAEMD